MEPLQLLITVTVLAILAEATYLVVKLPRQNVSRKAGRPILIDTSVLIDGRILSVAQSGFIGDTLVIPRSVIGELQYLADNADHEKRARARHGLDVVSELQAMPQVEVEILQDGCKAEEGVDERLLNLAKKYKAAVCTIDYNLNKVAVVEGITILNVNELAQSLRMAYLPGEKMLLELVQKGQDSHQAVGYLVDGTMVVVEHAFKHIGQTVEIEFIRSLQTAAGKMMFARPVEAQAKPVVAPKGRKPAVRKPRNSPVEAPKPEMRPEVVVAPAAQPAPRQTPAKAYHSDSRDNRRKSAPANNNRNQSQSARPSNPNRPARQKPRSSSDRENDLIKLLDQS